MAPVVPEGCATVSPATTVGLVDLRTWLLDAHRDMRTRLDGAVLAKVPVERWAETPPGGGSSITWLTVHLARHHDLALQTAIRNRAPLFTELLPVLGLDPAHHAAGTGLTEREDTVVTEAIDPAALVAYVAAVFDTTERWLQRLSAMAMDSIPDTGRRLVRLGGLDTDDFGWLIAMWSGRPVSWLVQWPLLGHANAHIGEAIAVRNRLGYNPF
jgi:hypothetical protein